MPTGTIKKLVSDRGFGFIAAEDGRPVAMRHVLRAARTEYAKLDRTPTEAEIAGWR